MFSCGSDDSFEREEKKRNSDEFHSKEEIDSSEKQEGNYLKKYFKDDDKLFFSNLGTIESYNRAHGVTDEDVMGLENEVEDMKRAVKKLQNALSLDRRLFEFFGVETMGEQEGQKNVSGEENENAALEQIEKMDALLRAKVAEERKAKLGRIEAEEESRDILSSLPRVHVSNGVKINMEEFLKLLNDADETESDDSRLQDLEQGNRRENKEKSNDCGPEGNKVEKKHGGRRKTKNMKFIEKNIRLAKCGCGTLSMTDEEKLRIEKLLSNAPSCSSGNLHETKLELGRIDERLEAVTKAQSTNRCRRTEALEKNLSTEENEREKAVLRAAKNSETNGKRGVRGVRLADIDQLLNQFNSVCHEEIIPMSEEELGNLVEESKQEEGVKENGEEKTDAAALLGVRCSEDVISELVLNAKLLMPRFKYRFSES